MAELATNYSELCTFSHGQVTYNTALLPWATVGQNMAANVNMDWATVINQWYDEKQYFNYDDLSCATGQMCGHYTQVSDANVYYRLILNKESVYKSSSCVSAGGVGRDNSRGMRCDSVSISQHPRTGRPSGLSAVCVQLRTCVSNTLYYTCPLSCTGLYTRNTPCQK